jgi:hypothetical protein
MPIRPYRREPNAPTTPAKPKKTPLTSPRPRKGTSPKRRGRNARRR